MIYHEGAELPIAYFKQCIPVYFVPTRHSWMRMCGPSKQRWRSAVKTLNTWLSGGGDWAAQLLEGDTLNTVCCPCSLILFPILQVPVWGGGLLSNKCSNCPGIRGIIIKKREIKVGEYPSRSLAFQLNCQWSICKIQEDEIKFTVKHSHPGPLPPRRTHNFLGRSVEWTLSNVHLGSKLNLQSLYKKRLESEMKLYFLNCMIRQERKTGTMYICLQLDGYWSWPGLGIGNKSIFDEPTIYYVLYHDSKLHVLVYFYAFCWKTIVWRYL
jgi:hypothetical protein